MKVQDVEMYCVNLHTNRDLLHAHARSLGTSYLSPFCWLCVCVLAHSNNIFTSWASQGWQPYKKCAYVLNVGLFSVRQRYRNSQVNKDLFWRLSYPVWEMWPLIFVKTLSKLHATYGSWFTISTKITLVKVHAALCLCRGWGTQFLAFTILF